MKNSFKNFMIEVTSVKLIGVVLLSVLFFSNYSLAQLSEGGVPYSFSNTVQTPVNTVQMPSIDINALLIEDSQDEDKGIPFRFGYPIEMEINFFKQGTFEQLANGDKLWTLRIYAPGAISINLNYNDFWLPAGAKLYLYNDARDEVIGAFTNRNNKENGEFATGILRGDATTLEYYEPAKVESPAFITISSVVHGYKDIFTKFDIDGFGSSGACNNNTICPEGDDWRNEIRAVGMILTSGGSRICSGAMINNIRQDLTPYFLTANHCVGSGSANWIIMFRYASPQCSPSVNGPLNYTVQGTELKANNSSSDFALFRLLEAPPDSFNIHFAGWSAINIPSTSSVGIHHPAGDVKKISFDYDPTTSSDYTPSPYLANSHWEITMWDDGTTEGGSSGSPLFDQNKRIVGQLHGGWASCTSLTQDYYGKFSMSWNYGSTPATRLRDWLDPDNTGALTLNGWDPTIGTPDTVAPSQILNLSIINPTSNSLTLQWTVPYDSSYNGVTGYDIRYSLSPINDPVTFNNASVLPFAGTPGSFGSTETISLSQLNFSTTYYFAIKSKDIWNNWSVMSNPASGTTWIAPQISVSPTSINQILPPATVKIDTIVISNITSLPSTLDFSVSLENNSFPDGLVLTKLEYSSANTFTDKTSEQNKDDQPEVFGASIDGQGGPDAFGYEWIDSNDPEGPDYIWQDISTTGTLVNSWIQTGTFDARDEGYAGPFSLGFNFNFYGNDKNQVYISSNGLLTFSSITSNIYTNTSIPTSAIPNEFIAPFWDDLDGTAQGTVHYRQEGNRFIVQFTNWQRYSATGSLTFQVVLQSNGKIIFYYNNMTGTLNSASVGIEDASGTTGLQIAYNAAYIGNGLAIQISSEPDWLSNNINNGTIYHGNSLSLVLTFASEDYPQGIYSMDVKINSNDPVNNVVTIPVIMNIGVVYELTSLTALIEGLYNGSEMVPDTVIVELRNASAPYSLIDQSKVFLNSNGIGSAMFTNIANGTPYYLVLKHRNSIETWSAATQTFSANTLSYDFTASVSQAYENNLVPVNGKWCLFSGDVNQDGFINMLDLSQVYQDNLAGMQGYISSDVNGDMFTESRDLFTVFVNYVRGIQRRTPPGYLLLKNIPGEME